MNKNNEEKKLASVSINWYPGHMAKTKKQIIEDLKLIDVVIELLDARIPISSQNPDFKKIIGNKKKIVVLNKCDLSDEKENKKWVNFFEKNEIKAVLTDANSGFGINEVTRQIESIMKEDLEKYASKGRKGRAIRVMILGIPNVGKSSFINRVSKKTSALVGNKPGVTRASQWIRLKDNIQLLDTPGVLWPKFENEQVALNLSYIGTIKDEIIDKVEISFNLIKYLLENYRENLLNRYKISTSEIEEIMAQEQKTNEVIMSVFYLIGKKRGAIVSGGNVNEEKTANLILDDFRASKLGKITLEKVN